jgi:hypothetical protein
MAGQAQLLEIIGTLDSVGRFPNFLDGRQEQTHQHGKNGHNDKKLDQGKGTPWHVS